jgi:hypothetical protein
MTPILLRTARLDALDLGPSHQIASFESANGALGDAKGTPLSVRMAAGRPKSSKALPNTEKANSERVDESPLQASRWRDRSSVIVSG